MKFFNTDDLVTMRLTGETKHPDANSSYIFPNPRPIVSYGVRPLNLYSPILHHA
jgi:hypothetical protein